VALGAFDGVHRGHQAVIAAAAEAARRLDVPLGVVTFEPHPRRWFQPDAPPFRVTSPGQQARALAALGVRRLYRLPFDTTMAGLTDEGFAREVLAEGLGVRHVAAGADITFGKGRTGDARLLEAYGEALGFGVSVAPLLIEEGAKCSSTAIREAVQAGDMARAAELLGRPFAIEGVVVHGDHLGRTIGFPTANTALGDYVRPRSGIYASRTRMPDGRHLPGVAYVGRRPTVNGLDERLEVNLFDLDEDLYGQVLETELVAFLRGDQKFDGLDALKAQIARDCEAARAVLKT
jgi:riboflavin kinase/FMN adenylyltransferase